MSSAGSRARLVTAGLRGGRTRLPGTAGAPVSAEAPLPIAPGPGSGRNRNGRARAVTRRRRCRPGLADGLPGRSSAGRSAGCPVRPTARLGNSLARPANNRNRMASAPGVGGCARRRQVMPGPPDCQADASGGPSPPSPHSTTGMRQRAGQGSRPRRWLGRVRSPERRLALRGVVTGRATSAGGPDCLGRSADE